MPGGSCGVLCGRSSTHEPTLMKTIQMTIDEDLLTLVDQLSRSLNTTRSAFIRRALEAQIARQRLQEDEARHAQGYLDKPVSPGEFDEWKDEQDWGAR